VVVVAAGTVTLWAIRDRWSTGPASAGAAGTSAAAPGGTPSPGLAGTPSAAPTGTPSPGPAGAGRSGGTGPSGGPAGPGGPAAGAGRTPAGQANPGSNTTKTPTNKATVYPRTRTNGATFVREDIGVSMTLVSGSGAMPDYRFYASINGAGDVNDRQYAAANLYRETSNDGYEYHDIMKVTWSMGVYRCTGEKLRVISGTDQNDINGKMYVDTYGGSLYARATITSFEAKLYKPAGGTVTWRRSASLTVTTACFTL
jgi:hypothetical protein